MDSTHIYAVTFFYGIFMFWLGFVFRKSEIKNHQTQMNANMKWPDEFTVHVKTVDDKFEIKKPHYDFSSPGPFFGINDQGTITKTGPPEDVLKAPKKGKRK